MNLRRIRLNKINYREVQIGDLIIDNGVIGIKIADCPYCKSTNFINLSAQTPLYVQNRQFTGLVELLCRKSEIVFEFDEAFKTSSRDIEVGDLIYDQHHNDLCLQVRQDSSLTNRCIALDNDSYCCEGSTFNLQGGFIIDPNCELGKIQIYKSWKMLYKDFDGQINIACSISNGIFTSFNGTHASSN